MSEEEVIKQIEDLILDRESFIQNDKEYDDIFLKDIQALKTVLQLLEQKDNKINKAIDKLKEHKCNLDYEPWSIYKVNGSILFDLVEILEE